MPKISVIHLPDGGKVAVCFAPGTTSKKMKEGLEIIRQRVLSSRRSEFRTGGSWNQNQGTPVRLRWSFVPDGVSADGTASVLFSNLDGKFASNGGRTQWVSLFQDVFSRYAATSGLSYDRVVVSGDADDGAAWNVSGADNLRGDVRIAANSIDGQFNVLAYNYFPGNGAGGNMVLDSAEDWAGTTFPELKANVWRFMRNTIAHEHGHGIGIDHVCPVNETKLLEPSLSLAFDTIQHDDLRAVHSLYGDMFEPNDTSGTATPFGLLSADSDSTFGIPLPPISGNNSANLSTLSIEGTGKEDWYSFSTTRAVQVRATVTPIGTTYLEGAQNANGSCTAGTQFNSLTLANLAVEVLDANGVQVGTATTNAAGVADEAVAIVPGAGNYFIRVRSLNSHTQAQMYRLRLQTIHVAVALGNVTMQGVSASALSSGILEVELYAAGQPTPLETRVVAMGTNGSFVAGFTASPGTYDVVLKTRGTLRRRFNGVVLDGIQTLNAVLFPGDVNGDNRVSTTDFAILSRQLGTTPSSGNWDANADLDRNGVVDATDLALCRANLRRNGN